VVIETLQLGAVTLVGEHMPTAVRVTVINDLERPAGFLVTTAQWSSLLALADTKLAGEREVERLRAELAAVNKRASDALDYMKFYTGDTHHLRNAEEILVGNMDTEGNWIVTKAGTP
jgi:hypothetical protein